MGWEMGGERGWGERVERGWEEVGRWVDRWVGRTGWERSDASFRERWGT